jgi:hypothetical protein
MLVLIIAILTAATAWTPDSHDPSDSLWVGRPD